MERDVFLKIGLQIEAGILRKEEEEICTSFMFSAALPIAQEKNKSLFVVQGEQSSGCLQGLRLHM